MISTDFIKKKPVPSFVKEHYSFIYPIKIEKVFPPLGLKNCSSKLSSKLQLAAADYVYVILHAINTFNTEVKNKFNLNKITETDLLRLSVIKSSLTNIANYINNGLYSVDKDDKLLLSRDIVLIDKSLVIKAGTDIYSLVSQILKDASLYVSIDLLNDAELNKGLSKAKVSFASDGEDGLWDILTMSMRGIKSCMRWKSNQAPALVGSLLDPCCGLLYISNPTRTSYGSKMLFRAVVRYVYDKRTQKEALLIDKTYSPFYKNAHSTPLDKNIRNIFISFLKEQTNNSIDIIDWRDAEIINYAIPQTENTIIDETYGSYRDCQVQYDGKYWGSIANILKHFRKDVPKVVKTKLKTKPKPKVKSKVSVKLDRI